jgi:hypothetical protein
MYQTTILTCFVIVFTSFARGTNTVSDSLPILNHYTQDGKTLKRRNMEKMLLTVNEAGPHVKKAKKYRIASNLIGLSLWGISLGITISQLTSILRDVEEGKPPITTELDKFMLPLSIGGEVSSLFQVRFIARSKYYTRKGVVAFNNQLCPPY